MSAVLSFSLVQLGLWGFLVLVSSINKRDASDLVNPEA